MRRTRWIGPGLALLLAGSVQAQAPTPASPPPPGTIVVEPEVAPQQTLSPGAVSPESRQEQITAMEQPAPAEPKLGPTPPEDLGWFNNLIDKTRIYGWADAGYTYSSS